MCKLIFCLIDVKWVFNKLKSFFLLKCLSLNVKIIDYSFNLDLIVYILVVLFWYDNFIVRLYNKWIFNKKGLIGDELIVYWLSVLIVISLIFLRE